MAFKLIYIRGQLAPNWNQVSHCATRRYLPALFNKLILTSKLLLPRFVHAKSDLDSIMTFLIIWRREAVNLWVKGTRVSSRKSRISSLLPLFSLVQANRSLVIGPEMTKNWLSSPLVKSSSLRSQLVQVLYNIHRARKLVCFPRQLG